MLVSHDLFLLTMAQNPYIPAASVKNPSKETPTTTTGALLICALRNFFGGHLNYETTCDHYGFIPLPVPTCAMLPFPYDAQIHHCT